MSLNRVVLVGRLTRDPDLRYTSNGIAVANFTVACNRPFKKENGEQEADFVNCVVWRKPAENLANYMKKGSRVGVDGRIQTRTYDEEGRTIFVTEVLAESVQFLESKSSSSNKSNDRGLIREPEQRREQQQDYNPFQNEGEEIDIADDGLPF